MPEVMKISAEGADSEDDEHPRISELVFRIENVTKYKVRESIKSPTKLVELFNYQVEVYPMEEITQGFKVYIVSVPMDGVNRSITYENIEYAVTLVNHRDDRKSITCRVANDSFSTDEVSLGMNLLQGKLLPAKLSKRVWTSAKRGCPWIRMMTTRWKGMSWNLESEMLPNSRKAKMLNP
ncbi:hypothetical protein FOZ63_015387, partial [Perkinsus olseni]